MGDIDSWSDIFKDSAIAQDVERSPGVCFEQNMAVLSETRVEVLGGKVQSDFTPLNKKCNIDCSKEESEDTSTDGTDFLLHVLALVVLSFIVVSFTASSNRMKKNRIFKKPRNSRPFACSGLGNRDLVMGAMLLLVTTSIAFDHEVRMHRFSRNMCLLPYCIHLALS